MEKVKLIDLPGAGSARAACAAFQGVAVGGTGGTGFAVATELMAARAASPSFTEVDVFALESVSTDFSTACPTCEILATVPLSLASAVSLICCKTFSALPLITSDVGL